MENILDFTTKDNVLVTDKYIDLISNALPFKNTKQRHIRLLMYCMYSALIFRKSKKDFYVGNFKSIRYDPEYGDIEVTMDLNNIIELFSIEADKESRLLIATPYRKARAIEICESIVEAVTSTAILLREEHCYSGYTLYTKANLDDETKIFTSHINRRAIDTLLKWDGGYGKMEILPSLLFSKKANFLYIILCKFQDAIITGKLSNGEEYTGHSIIYILNNCKLNKYNRNVDAFRELEEVLQEINIVGKYNFRMIKIFDLQKNKVNRVKFVLDN